MFRISEVEGDRPLRTVEKVEELRRTATRAVRSCSGLHFDHRCPGVGQQVAAERPGPQRREINHPKTFGSCGRRRSTEARRHDARSAHLTDSGDWKPEQRGPLEQVDGVAVREGVSNSRPGGGLGDRLTRKLRATPAPGRGPLPVAGRPPPSPRTRQQMTASTVARRPSAPQSHQCGALTEQCQRIEFGKRRPHAVEPFQQPERRSEWARQRPGQSHQAAGRPALHNRVRHLRRVTSRDSGHSQCRRSP